MTARGRRAERLTHRLRGRRIAGERVGLSAAIEPTLVVSLLLVTVLLFWYGYRATREWERANLESLHTRGNEVLALLSVALERDMKGALTTVLMPVNVTMLERSSRFDFADRFAGAFARFPYLESFFVWEGNRERTARSYFFNRADRPPPWDRSADDDDVYPVLIRNRPAEVQDVLEAARREARRGVRFAMYDIAVGGVPYQTLVHLFYAGQTGELVSAVGFMVNLNWVRDHYFHDFIRYVQDFTGDRSIEIAIHDERGQRVAHTGADTVDPPLGRKTFPLLFADPSLLTYLAPQDRTAPFWTAQVSIGGEAAMLAAERATARTLTVLGLAALVTVAGLVWTVRAARAAADLATARAEFVSAVSHEMKTPLSLISLASDTLANGRYSSPATIPEYGRFLSKEAHHLRRLIDNVLCYARLNSREALSLEEVDVSELIEDSVERFRPYLAELEFDVQVQLPLDPLSIRADRVMMLHVLDNLIDNAAKHGAAGKHLAVSAAAENGRVRIEVTDAGRGIAPGELARVFDKFYRGKGTRTRGTGLGLAIVQRIVADHGGSASVTSEIGRGTTVTIILPAGGPRT